MGVFFMAAKKEEEKKNTQQSTETASPLADFYSLAPVACHFYAPTLSVLQPIKKVT